MRQRCARLHCPPSRARRGRCDRRRAPARFHLGCPPALAVRAGGGLPPPLSPRHRSQYPLLRLRCPQRRRVRCRVARGATSRKWPLRLPSPRRPRPRRQRPPGPGSRQLPPARVEPPGGVFSRGALPAWSHQASATSQATEPPAPSARGPCPRRASPGSGSRGTYYPPSRPPPPGRLLRPAEATPCRPRPSRQPFPRRCSRLDPPRSLAHLAPAVRRPSALSGPILPRAREGGGGGGGGAGRRGEGGVPDRLQLSIGAGLRWEGAWRGAARATRGQAGRERLVQAPGAPWRGARAGVAVV